MLQHFNIPGQTGKPYIVRAILDGETIAQGECAINCFTYTAYKACYNEIPAEYESRISEIVLVDHLGNKTQLETWLKVNGL